MLILLTAVDLGLGALFFRIVRMAEVKAAFGIPERVTPIGAIAIGWPKPNDRPLVTQDRRSAPERRRDPPWSLGRGRKRGPGGPRSHGRRCDLNTIRGSSLTGGTGGVNSDAGGRKLARASAAHRAHRDWPSGTVTPRLRVLLVRDSRTAGGLCSCPAAARALRVT